MSDDFDLGVEEPSGGYKPAFDGRQMYYKVMGKFLLAQKVSALQGSVWDWYRGLRILNNMVTAYVDPKEGETIEKALNKIESDLQKLKTAMILRNQMMLSSNIEKSLLEVDKRLHIAAKEVFLPVRKEEEKGWDDEDFKRRSDA